MAVQKGCFRSARKSLNWQRGNSGLLLVGRLQSADHPNLDRDVVAKSFPAESGSYVRTSHFYRNHITFFLETAINGRADAIVTFNERDFRPVAARFRCSVVRPGEIVRGLVEEAE